MVRGYFKLFMALSAFALSPYAFDGNCIRNKYGDEWSPFWSGVICLIIGVCFLIGFINEKFIKRKDLHNKSF